MQLNKIGLAILFSAVTFALSGCLDDKPSDKIASETIRKIADSDLDEGLEIANFKRRNGQVDPDSANRYTVTYSYDVRLVKPLAEVVLAFAKDMSKEFESSVKKQTGAFIDPTKLQNDVNEMQIAMAVNQWIKKQGDTIKQRRDTLLANCSQCIDYLHNRDLPEKELKKRHFFFVGSWIYFEDFGFKDSAKVGDSVPRIASASFSKTEKGWQPIN